MNKLNFTRWEYLRNFCNNICNHPSIKKENIVEEIDFQINRIYAKTKDGYWGIPESDQTFIALMTELKRMVQEDKRVEIENIIRRTEYEKKVKVVFLCQETTVWPSLKTAYEAMARDEKFNPQLVYLPFNHPNADKSIDHYDIYVNTYHLPMLRHTDYNLTQESPDIAILLKPYDLIPMQFYIKDIYKAVERTVLIPYGFYEKPYDDILLLYGYHLPAQNMVWLWVSHSEYQMEFIRSTSYTAGENARILGHPKFDASCGKIGYPHDEIYEKYAKKINGRRTLCWNAHHLNIMHPEISYATFFKFKDEILNFFHNHPELVLLFRPHPLLKRTLENNNALSSDEFEYFFDKINDEDNIIYDDSKDYINSFALSDAILTDGFSSLSQEYLATEKPVYYLVNQDGMVMDVDSVAKCFYWIRDSEELKQHLEDFVKGKDPLREQRLRDMQYFIGEEHGHAGERIRDYIYDGIVKEECERAKICFE